MNQSQENIIRVAEFQVDSLEPHRTLMTDPPYWVPCTLSSRAEENPSEAFMARNLPGLLARGMGILGLTWALGVVTVSASPLTFSVHTHPVDGIVLDLASGDFNGDGIQDLAALIWSSSSHVALFFGDGAGDFLAGPNIESFGPASEVAMISGDFDEDGRDEVAILGFGSLRFFHINPDDSLGPVSEISSIFFYNYGLTAVADFDLDGHLDLVLLSSSYYGRASLAFYSGDGHDGLGPPFFTDIQASPKTLTVGDADLDGVPDIVIANNSPTFVDFYLGHGDGSFAKGLRSFVYQDTDLFNGRASALGLADFNRDGRQDVAVTLNIDQSRTEIYVQREGGYFERSAGGRGTDRLDLGDFDSDGMVDVAVTDVANGTLWVNLTGLSSGPFGPFVTFTESLGFPSGLARPLVGGDFDRDGRRDLAVGSYNPQNSSNEVLIFVNQGPAADADHDGVADAEDPCTDTDGDGFGDPGFPASTCAP